MAALMYQFTQSLHPSKQSIAMKGSYAALDNDYALEVLLGHDVA